MIGLIRNLLRKSNRVTVIRGRYDAARSNDDNYRHWAMADHLSPTASNSASVRRILRSRARYEVANNTYARGIINTLANYTVGTGPRLQMTTDDVNTNRQIESRFAEWAVEVNLADKLRTMRVARACDGESFAVLTHNDGLRNAVKLDVKLIEADLVASASLAGASEDDGIRYDLFGNPIKYSILKYHPGDQLTFTNEAKEVDAVNVIHWFKIDRPGQTRGIPEITSALPLFAQLRRYTLAVVSAAETAANFSAILESDSPYDPNDPDAAAWQRIEIERNAMMTVPGGMKINQLKSEQPTSTYSEFKNQIINEIARCLEVPFNVAAGNSAGYNYASGRLDYQMFFKSLRIDQSQLITVVLDRIFYAWLDEALLIDGYLQVNTPFDRTMHTWFFDGLEHVDPQKEANAQAIRLENHTTTLAYEYAKQGRDWEEAVRQRAKELSLLAELGLPSNTTVQQQTNDPEDVNDNEEETASASS